MAGEGKRFQIHGIKQPKYELLVREKTIFEWAIMSFKKFYNQKFIFIIKPGVKIFVRRQCEKMRILNYRIIELQNTTDGQATSVLYGIQKINDTAPLLIHNIDTYINPNVFLPNLIQKKFDGWILLFRAPGSHWSFAQRMKNGRVTEVSEKVRISEFASSGTYFFRSKKIYEQAYYDAILETKEKYKEAYIMPLYNSLIKRKFYISSSLIELNNIIPLGTPEEVLNFDHTFQERYKLKF